MAAGGYYGFAGGAVAGPQYSAPPAPAYAPPPVAAAYAGPPPPSVDPSAASAYPLVLPAPRPPGAPPMAYGAYQPPSAQDYGYGARPPELAPQPPVAQGYQQEGYGYGRSPAAAAGGYEAKEFYPAVATQAQQAPGASDGYYHSAPQSGYSQPVAAYDPGHRQVTPVKLVPAGNAAPSSGYGPYPAATTGQQSLPPPSVPTYAPPASSYAPPATTATSYNASPASYAAPNYSAYDTAAYTAPSASYYTPGHHELLPPPPPQPPPPPPQQQPQQPQPQPPQAKPAWGGPGGAPSSSPAAGSYIKKLLFPSKPLKAKGPPKQPQLHYCEICKISCAGPQTYREHLEGQKHKKKEAALKAGGPAGGSGPRSGVPAPLHCELCDISCTGVDAYGAHIRGAKHQKVLKLHTKLGKPIPAAEPTLAGLSAANGLSGKPAPGAAASLVPPAKSAAGGPEGPSCKPPLLRKPTVTKPVFPGPPARQVANSKPAEARGTLTKAAAAASEEEEQPPLDGLGDGPADSLDVQPVGHHYVEEVLSDKGKAVRFHCKLCECSFNDPNAKDLHLRGRRHRLQYKKKVNPELSVEAKPSNRARKLQEEKAKGHQLPPQLQFRALAGRRQQQLQRQAEEQQQQQRWHLEMRRYEQEMYWKRVEEEEIYWAEQQRRRRLAPDWRPPPLMGRPGVPVPPLLPTRRPSSSDDRHVMAKHASIYPTEEELQGLQKAVSHSEQALRLVSDWLAGQQVARGEPSAEKGKAGPPPRLLKGVLRVGVLAKGLLLRGDRCLRLVLLTAQRPTRGLLWSVAEQLPKQLEKVTGDPYEVDARVEEAGLVVASGKEPKMQVTVSLTSPLMRDEAPGAPPEGPQPDAAEVLDREKCLEALAALRRAKWFQARANGLQSCVVVVRILRDLCRRVPTWGDLPGWAMELVVERSLSSATGPLGPGEALRRVLECLASGILLADGPGLRDPCEKEPVDALRGLARQQREDITASSQHALRMLAFRQIHRILGVDPPAMPRNRPGSGPARKRRWGAGEAAEEDPEGDGKRDRKEEEEEEEGAAPQEVGV